MAQDITPPDPGIVLDLLEAFRRSKAMFAAVSLGVFDALAAGPKSPTDLAHELQADPDALERLLDACVGLQLLRKQGDRYENTPAATAYLTRTSPHRLTGYITYSNDVLWKLWAQPRRRRPGGHPPLEAGLRLGGADLRPLLPHRGGQAGVPDGHARLRAHQLAARRRRPSTWAGSAAWSISAGRPGHLAIAACRRWPELRAVVFDLPEAVPLAREVVGASPVADRIEVVAGDFFADPLPEGDLFALGRILHDWTEEKILQAAGPHPRPPAAGRGRADRREAAPGGQDRAPAGRRCRTSTCWPAPRARSGRWPSTRPCSSGSASARCMGCRTPSPLDAVLAFKA